MASRSKNPIVDMGLAMLEAEGIDTTVTRRMLEVDPGIRGAAFATLISLLDTFSKIEEPVNPRIAELVTLFISLAENFTDLNKLNPTIERIFAILNE